MIYYTTHFIILRRERKSAFEDHLAKFALITFVAIILYILLSLRTIILQVNIQVKKKDLIFANFVYNIIRFIQQI